MKAGSRLLSVVIVGCGNIAGGFDRTRAADALPLSHAGAYSRDGRFELAVCVEPVAHVRDAFVRRWKPRASYGSLEKAINRIDAIDVVSICSPPAQHASNVRTALALHPALIFCEKPLAHNFEEAASIVAACERAGVQLAVNYTRRWDPDVRALENSLDKEQWGMVRSVCGYYNKGIVNSGSHLIDLLGLLFGPLKIERIGNSVSDYDADDPTVAVVLSGKNLVPINLVCGHAADYSLFELEIVTAEGAVRMEQGGMRWLMRNAEPSEHFHGYKVLSEGKSRLGRYPEAMACAVDNIYRAVCRGEALASTGSSALAAEGICDAIRSGARER